jgi:hypothetical protein
VGSLKMKINVSLMASTHRTQSEEGVEEEEEEIEGEGKKE